MTAHAGRVPPPQRPCTRKHKQQSVAHRQAGRHLDTVAQTQAHGHTQTHCQHGGSSSHNGRTHCPCLVGGARLGWAALLVVQRVAQTHTPARAPRPTHPYLSAACAPARDRTRLTAYRHTKCRTRSIPSIVLYEGAVLTTVQSNVPQCPAHSHSGAGTQQHRADRGQWLTRHGWWCR